MRAVHYARQGSAHDVLEWGELDDPQPGPGEVLVQVSHSAVNPGDVKKRADAFGLGMRYPVVVPHSDGAGRIVAVGENVPAERVGERVWVWGAQTYRAYGTAAELVALPADRAVTLDADVDPVQAACLGIPGLTAHHAVFSSGPVLGRTVLVNGAAGGVGLTAAQLAAAAGARVIATVRRERDAELVRAHGIADVLLLGEDTADRVRNLAPDGVDRIVEVALDANIELDVAVAAQGGSIAAYATGEPQPRIPFWPMLFSNLTLVLVGSDDLSDEVRARATADLTAAVTSGSLRFPIAAVLPLAKTADAHELTEHPAGPGKVVLEVAPR